MGLIAAHNDLEKFLREPENAQNLNGLVEDVRYALIDYQVCAFNRLVLNASNTFLRLLYNKKSTKNTVRRL